MSFKIIIIVVHDGNIGRLFAGKEMEETEGNSQQSLEDWVESLRFNI